MSDTELPLSDSPSLIKKAKVGAKEGKYFTFILTISSVFMKERGKQEESSEVFRRKI